jgi:hypothetical protein
MLKKPGFFKKPGFWGVLKGYLTGLTFRLCPLTLASKAGTRMLANILNKKVKSLPTQTP